MVEPLTPDQIAAMLPDQLRVYQANLEAYFTARSADLSEALRKKFEAAAALLRANAEVDEIKHEVASIKVRMSSNQSILKSLKEGF